MRRDICFVFPVDVARLYNAYLTVATNNRFRRECHQEPYHTLQFGLNFSMKYNFNGGSCTLRFMPVDGGSAVNMRFSLAQLAGARYEKYAKDMTDEVIAVLGVMPARANIDVEAFLAQNGTVAAPVAPAAPVASAPVGYAAPNPAPAYTAPAPNPGYIAPAPTQTGFKFCTNCGQKHTLDANFCTNCGTRM